MAGLKKRMGTPIIGISGFKNSGKTVMTEKLVRYFTSKGLKIGYFKYNAHHLQIDRKGKDTQRIFSSGANTCAINTKEEGAIRFRIPEPGWTQSVFDLQLISDIIFVEGFKRAPWPKVWMWHGTKESFPPGDVCQVILRASSAAETACASSDSSCPDIHRDNVEEIAFHIQKAAQTQISKRRRLGAIQISGQDKKADPPQHPLNLNEKGNIDHIRSILTSIVDQVYLLGCAKAPEFQKEFPCLPNAFEVANPLSELLSAFRFAPDADWIVANSGMGHVTADSIKHLLGERKLGYRAAVCREQEDTFTEPWCGIYSPEFLNQLYRQSESSSLPELLVKYQIKSIRNF